MLRNDWSLLLESCCLPPWTQVPKRQPVHRANSGSKQKKKKKKIGIIATDSGMQPVFLSSKRNMRRMRLLRKTNIILQSIWRQWAYLLEYVVPYLLTMLPFFTEARVLYREYANLILRKWWKLKTAWRGGFSLKCLRNSFSRLRQFVE